MDTSTLIFGIIIIVVAIALTVILAVLTAYFKKYILETVHMPIKSLGQLLPPLWEHSFFLPILFVGACIFLVCATIGHWSSWDGLQHIVRTIIGNTLIGSIAEITKDGFSFAPASLVAIAFSGYIGSIIARSLSDKNVALRIFANFIITIAFAFLAHYMTPLFTSIGNWGYDSINFLFKMDDVTFLAKLGRILLLIPLAYAAVYLLTITVYEYAATLSYGLLIAILMALLTSFLSSVSASETLSGIILLVIISFSDMLRNFLEDKLEERLTSLKDFFLGFFR